MAYHYVWRVRCMLCLAVHNRCCATLPAVTIWCLCRAVHSTALHHVLCISTLLAGATHTTCWRGHAVLYIHSAYGTCTTSAMWGVLHYLLFSDVLLNSSTTSSRGDAPHRWLVPLSLPSEHMLCMVGRMKWFYYKSSLV